MKQPVHTAVKLSGVALAMFAFGFLLVPIYDIVCDITGLNGKTGVVENPQMLAAMPADESRTVTVELVSNLNQSMPMEFTPAQRKIAVHPGETYTVDYVARNLTDARMVGQAAPSVSPAAAAAYLDKVECFCFTEQIFEARESRTLPVRFIVSPNLPTHIKTLSLAYTFFDVTDKQT